MFAENIFLGHKLFKDGIDPDPAKVDSSLKTPYPENLKQVQQALGRFNYYGQFIFRKLDIADSISKLLKKGVEFESGEKQQKSFDGLETAMATHPVLAMYEPELEIQPWTDASDIGVAGVLLQNTLKGGNRSLMIVGVLMTSSEEFVPLQNENCGL